MRTLAIDLETYSSNDIKYSVYKYVEAPDFEILLFAYAFDDDPVRVVDLAQGETIPDDVKAALYDKDVLKTAFNANFEINCLKKCFPDLPEEQWECDRILSLYNSYPPHLAAVAKAMHFDADQQKDTRGKALIRYFCLPCKPTKANGGRTRNYPKDAPDKWAIFKEYNRQDVVVERAIRDKLVNLRPPDFEHENWLIDQAINRNGIMVNQTLVDNAIRLSGEYREKLLAQAMEITGLDNPNSPLQVKGWLEERLGRAVDSLSKAAVADMLAEDIPGDVREMLSIRQKISKSSIKKYDAMRLAACKDSRIRGMFQFYGAARTGRFAGRIVQLQNLPRNSMPDLDLARNMVLDGDLETLEMCYEDVQDVLSQLIRTALEAPPGKRFIVADFSAIEARVIAWLAGEEWEMKAFAEGKDIYCATASAMFGVPVVKHGVNGELRQKGKVATLACIAEGQEVLTDRGLVPIEKVTKDMKVWDGEEFVNHAGVIYKGVKEVMTYEGLTATPDHLVWVEGASRPVRFKDAATIGAHLVQAGNGRQPLRLGHYYQPGKTLVRKLESLLCSDAMHRLREYSVAKFGESPFWEIERMPTLLTAPANPFVVGPTPDSSETTLRESVRPSVSQLWRKRNPFLLFQRNRSRLVLNPDIRPAETEIGNRQDRQQSRISAGKYTVCNPKAKCWKPSSNGTIRIPSPRLALFLQRSNTQTVSGGNQGTDYAGRAKSGTRKAEELARHTETARVYDIKDAGPNHRFTVSGKLVHNCGYGGGIGALKAMGADKMGLSDDELQTVVRKWREASPHIVKLWSDVENAAMNAVAGIPTTIKQHGLHFHVEDDALYIELPSGRHLVYLHPHLGKNRFGSDAIIYTGLGGSKTTAGRWGALETYGGKLVENCLAEGTLVLTDHGLIPIELIDCISKDIRIWDGVRYVQHEGVIDKGVQHCIKIDGLYMTPEHLILTKKGWTPGAKAHGLTWENVASPFGYQEIRGQHSRIDCNRQNEYTMPVFDIRNCGPRHRFAVYDPETKKVRLVHNCVQAIARDCLCAAMKRLTDAGYKICAHIHDEAILEMPEGKGSLDDAVHIMCQNEPWNDGLVMDADGFEAKYYQKD